jgi:hypothetical protein
MLVITGWIGILGLCSFSCAFNVGGGVFWIRYFIFCLPMINLHCCNVFCISFWYLSVGSLENGRKQKEWTLIQLIARNNNFPLKLLHKLNLQIQHKKTNQEQTNDSNTNKTWTTFTYYSPKIRKITNLFKHTNLGITFKNTNTLQQLTKPKTDTKSLEQDKSGIYEPTCNTCHMSYTGQRYQEHIRYIKTMNPSRHMHYTS